MARRDVMRLLMLWALITAAVLRADASSGGVLPPAAGAPVRLRVEYMEAPLGVDVPYPRFSWSAGHSRRNEYQTAYRLVVNLSSSVQTGSAVSVWDSGRVVSNWSQLVPIADSVKLTADTSYTWSVRWWDSAGAESPEGVSTFSTGLFREADWKGAGWIGGEIGQYRKAFAVKGPVLRATAYIVGLGYYQMFMNGNKLSSHELGAFTTFEERVLYDTVDVTAAINAGLSQPAQVLGVVLGNGWYSLGSTDPFDGAHPIDVGPPTLRLRLSIQYAAAATAGAAAAPTDIISDTSWTHTMGPVSSSHIYMGTIYNATQETPGWTTASFEETSVWSKSKIVAPPSDHVKLTSHAVMPQIRTTQSFTPCNLWQSAVGVFVFDFCQNLAGVATLRVPEGVATEANVLIEMIHAEAIHGPPENHSAIFNHYKPSSSDAPGKSFEMNTYVTSGDGAAIEWTPSFTYSGFRYVQLTGHPGTPDYNTLTAHFIHTDNEDVGSVSFSDPLLNSIQHMTRASAMSNFQNVPTDCPQ